jgi:V8-like Glu-specific endopeptidase
MSHSKDFPPLIHSKHRAGVIIASIIAGAMIIAAPMPANAASPESPSDDTTAVSAPIYSAGGGDSRQDANAPETSTGNDAVSEYWTDERLAKATPVASPTVDDAVSAQIEKLESDAIAGAGPEVTSAPAAAAEGPSAQATPVTKFSHTNGRIFFRGAVDGLDYSCSGSALNSGSKRLVATAGHCVHGGPGGDWHENWVFVPGYHDGDRPHGTFQARTLRTFTAWIDFGVTGRGLNSDVAFVTTFSSSTTGDRVVDAVGGHGIITGGSEYVFDVSIFGYPGNRDDGEIMWACWGRTGIRTFEGFAFITIRGCGFGGGSSGGPWLKDYSNSSGQGFLKTVTSWGPTNGVAHINGPFFRSAVRDLYNAANADW